MMSDDGKVDDITPLKCDQYGMENKKLVILPEYDPKYIIKKQQFTCDLQGVSIPYTPPPQTNSELVSKI